MLETGDAVAAGAPRARRRSTFFERNMVLAEGLWHGAVQASDAVSSAVRALQVGVAAGGLEEWFYSGAGGHGRDARAEAGDFRASCSSSATRASDHPRAAALAAA